MSQDRFAHKKTEGAAHGAVIRYYTINLGLHTTEMNCSIKGSALNVVGNSVAKKKTIGTVATGWATTVPGAVINTRAHDDLGLLHLRCVYDVLDMRVHERAQCSTTSP